MLAQSLILSAIILFFSGFASSSRPSIGEYIREIGFYQSIDLSDQVPLLDKHSQYQHIQVHHSEHYGHILVLDGVIQLTEKDADSYNEMMAHMAMMAHPNPRRVLVIGGGDGYVLSEVLKHDSVEVVDHVDLDGEVIDVCREFFSWGSAWDDPRVRLHHTDGAEFVRKAQESYYDVVIQDSSDPTVWNEDEGIDVELPAAVLYSNDHVQNIYRALSENGVFNFQAETMQIPVDFASAVQWRRQILSAGFERSRYGSITIGTYPTGRIGFLLCEKSALEVEKAEIEARFDSMCNSGKKTTYYHPRLQFSSFDLPLWAELQMYGDSVLDSSPTCLEDGSSDTRSTS